MRNQNERKFADSKPELVKYEAVVPVMDIISDPERTKLMLAKVRENLKRAKTLVTVQEWIARDLEEVEGVINRDLERYRNLQLQVAFIDKLISGEIPFVEAVDGLD